MNSFYKKYIQRTFFLAQKGAGKVSPNPLVGCVIVHNNKIIGESYHKKYGDKHAEINAINAIQNKSIIKNSSVFINLEPCSHYGKTPPCINALIKLKPKEVIISNKDPNPKVNGQGISMLKNSGLKVIVGILEKEGEKLNKRFFTFIRKKRPYIILKWAETKNGMIANERYESKWISNNLSRQLVHKWRAQEDAILVGASTVEHDNPQLTVRHWKGKNPIRVIIDPKGRVNLKSHIYNNLSNTIILTNINENKKKYLKKIKINSFEIKEINSFLVKETITSILIEGGAFTLGKFITSNQWDEIRIFQSNKTFKKGIKAPIINKLKLYYREILQDKLFIKYND